MNIEAIGVLFQFVGGLGMFLYGMNQMADGLQKSAGHRMQKLLGVLTSNRLMGVLLGAGITAIIQSSAATSIMCLGFVNAGIMVLRQAIPVIMGANIGSTVTGQILRLGDISDQNLFLTMLKPSSFAPILIAFGVICIVFLKNKQEISVIMEHRILWFHGCILCSRFIFFNCLYYKYFTIWFAVCMIHVLQPFVNSICILPDSFYRSWRMCPYFDSAI